MRKRIEVFIIISRTYFYTGLEHNQKEYKTKPTSPIRDKCTCGSGSFLMRKMKGKYIVVCRKCAKRRKVK